MIDGLKIRLRGLELADAETIHKNWNSLELRTYLASRLPNPVEEEQDFIKATWNSKRRGDLILGIETLERKLVGTISFERLWSITSGSAEVGIAIWEPAERSKGDGTEAMHLLSFYAFEVLGLHRLQLHVMAYNKRGIASYKKVGYKEVGVLKEADYIYNKFQDMVLMELLTSEVTYPAQLNKKLDSYRSLAT